MKGFYDAETTTSLHLRLRECNLTACPTINHKELLSDKYIALLSNQRIYDRTQPADKQI